MLLDPDLQSQTNTDSDPGRTKNFRIPNTASVAHDLVAFARSAFCLPGLDRCAKSDIFCYEEGQFPFAANEMFTCQHRTCCPPELGHIKGCGVA
jgi:hypothetical protein